MWTLFWDMHSGGGQKLDWPMIYIELPEKEAIRYFEEKFDRHPSNVTCDCCGNDYSISSAETLEEVSAYHRNCIWINPVGDERTGKYLEGDGKRGMPIPEGWMQRYPASRDWVNVEEYLHQNICVIRKEDVAKTENYYE